MTDGEQEFAREAIFEALENQLRENDPPEVRETLDRLIGAGHSRDDAKRLIAIVLASEIFDVLKTQKGYDNDRYVARLRQLPDLSWQEE